MTDEQKRPKRGKGEIKYLDQDQQKQLLSVVQDIRDKLVIRMLLATGMRIEEFTLVKKEDIDEPNGFIRLLAENTKTKEARSVYVERELLNDLMAYLKMKSIDAGYIWRGTVRGRPITTRALQLMVKKYGRLAGLEWLHAHTFRHTCAVNAISAGVATEAVQGQLGHKSFMTTQIYTKLAPRQVADAFRRAGL
jgi:integrase/recombinase XerD